MARFALLRIQPCLTKFPSESCKQYLVILGVDLCMHIRLPMPSPIATIAQAAQDDNSNKGHGTNTTAWDIKSANFMCASTMGLHAAVSSMVVCHQH